MNFTNQLTNRFGYIFLAYASLFCYGLIDNSRPAAYPLMLEYFGVSMTVGSLIFLLPNMAGLPMIMLSRYWLKWLGEVKSQIAFLLLIAVGCLGMGMSGYLANGYTLMLISATVFGLGLGGTTVSTNILVAFGSSPKDSRRLFSGLHAMYGVSSILGPVIFVLVSEVGYGWREMFLYLSILPLIALALNARTKQINHGFETSGKPVGLKFSGRLKIGFVISFYAAAEVAISSRLVLFVTKTEAMSAAEAAPYLTLFFVLLMAGRFIFSIYQFPWQNRSIMLASLVSSFVLFLAGIFWHPAFLSACGLAMSYYFPCGMDWISRRFGEGTGFMMASVMTSVDIVLVVMHLGVGFISDSLGIKTAMLLGPAFLVAPMILLLTLRED